MTVRTTAARLLGASQSRRALSGRLALCAIAIVGLAYSALLSGLPVRQSLIEDSNHAQDIWHPAPGALAGSQVIRPVTSDHFEALLKQADFDLQAVRAETAAVPRIYVRRLPVDLVEVDDTLRRKKLFFGAMLPLILMANEELRAERAHVEALRDRYPAVTRETGLAQLTDVDRRWLEAVHDRYETEAGDWHALLLRLDEIPVSLIMAQAIQESGWGTSRFARDGNALFGQRTWNPDEEGLVPDLRSEGQTYRVKSFPDLMAAVRSYMRNLNTHDAYKDLRAQRAKLRKQPANAPGRQLASSLTRYSEESAGYVKALRGLIRDNDLSALNRARLRPNHDLVASRGPADL
ncbi:glucosaminidase domain-containing protein [Denitrobaculum tricleocarpae]|uniref:Mannosyl-glycoprotein endo-beta-N-acetylglucosamidase-like domain-containing protein n=1 Tax=Denitrobaculum tricleocarpae TaxID=2591009 RepID=A0A545TRQ9_9PROT|nr:glucosaminidase domain-containing protein [Denitrobaculum tricleocarpae]TQV79904.1 hypothetical protein FKG95_14575 [Denitrobaculum tricleocarpae]